MVENPNLRDYITTAHLQKMQDSFSNVLGTGANISDAEGSYVIEPTGMCDFCKFTRVSRIGSQRCRQCDREGAMRAFEEGRAVSYTCHAGLTDFSAPLIIDGKMVGCFAGGQVRVGELDEEKVRQTAQDINVNPEMYLALARRTPCVSEEELKKAVEFVDSVSSCISDMADKQYQLENAKREIESAAKLRAEFLANISHEIRTPMNGVIGMAELALRENLSPEAEEYIGQIKSSGKTLLTLINDFLDFSKIESGKMDIICEEYNPYLLVNDIANVILTRIGDKPVELIADVDRNIPTLLYGDSVRIRQIITNLANNAVKFTNEGMVSIRLSQEPISDSEINLTIEVSDTGIGISEENITKLFKSFSQVDSQRNHSLEGTGLGLAICKQLVELMEGNISVASEYGKGSTFKAVIKQKVCENAEKLIVRDVSSIRAVGLLNNPYAKKQFETEMSRLGIAYRSLDSLNVDDTETFPNAEFFFADENTSMRIIEALAVKYEKLSIVVMEDLRSVIKYSNDNVTVIKKPVISNRLVDLLNRTEVKVKSLAEKDEPFKAPEARVLIVDDNSVNLSVARGLLKPIGLRADIAASGKAAITRLNIYKYDMIFMDHMMPEMDGIETTKLIRETMPEYVGVPIIALTANAMSGSREFFISEGMNDFMPKPIEIKVLYEKLRTWLPAEKIVYES